MTGRLVNGLTLVVIGAILLMNTVGYLPWGVWDAAFTYWPVLVIALGLQVLTSKRRIPFLALAIVIMLILGAMNPYGSRGSSWIVRNWRGFDFGLPRRTGEPLNNCMDWTVPLKSSVSEVEIEMKAPSLELEIAGDPLLNEKEPPHALSAYLSWSKTEPSTTFTESNGVTRVSIDAPDRAGSESGKQVWVVDLNPSLSTSLNVAAGVANVSLDCSSVFLREVTVAAGVADLNLKMGLTGKETKVRVSGGAACVSVAVPRSAGLRVTVSSPLTITHDLDSAGLTRSGNAWATADFDNASTKIDVVMTCGAGTVKVQRTD